jgi:DNA-binding SARP family transcriptional activator
LLEIRLFGPVEVTDRDRTLGPRDFGCLKAKQVLEVLLVERGRSVPKERLADLLWGERLPQNYLATVESYVSVLRSRLQPGGSARDSAVVTESGAYRFAQDRARLDLDVFDELVTAADTENGAAALALLIEAAGLARGEVLADEPYSEWTQNLREQYRRKVVQVLVRAARIALDLGDASQAVKLAERAISVDGQAEAAYRAVMLGSYRLGCQEEAVRAFERCRRALEDELGVEPMAETTDLLAAIQAHDESLSPPAPIRTLVSPLAATSPVSALGRSAELSALEDHVRDALAGQFSLIAVEGDPGIGKSRLLDDLGDRLSGISMARWRCSELETDFPFVAIAGALRNLEGAAGGISAEPLVEGAGPAAALAFLDQLAEHAKAHAPFVLLIDRLDLADPSTVSALGHLQRRLATLPVAVVATCRSVAIARPPVSRLTWSARVRLDRLTADELAAMDMPDLHATTGGHPVFLAACMASSTREPNPAELSELVLAWCADAGQAGVRTLSAAAVLAQPFDPVLLSRVLRVDAVSLDEELDRLCQHGLLHEQGSHFAFRDAPVRQILLHNLSPARRALLTARASRAESLPASSPEHSGRIDLSDLDVALEAS